MKKVTLQHVLGNKILEYDVDDRGVIIDEREKDRYAKQQDSKEKLMSNWINEHIVFQYDVKKQGATNETLKESAYLQDLSGKGRRMKLNNFLFDMMSGVDGYKNEAFVKVSGAIDIRFDHINGRQIKGKPAQDWAKFGYYRAKNMIKGIIYCKWHVEGILDDNKVYVAQYTAYDNRVELHNGDNYIELDTNQGKVGYNYISVISDQPYSTDITITQIPEYPGALVTDGVDDYGVVENFKSLQNYMMFFQCAIIRPTTLKGMFSTTSIATSNRGWMLLQGRSANSVKFGNYVYTDFKFTPSVEDKISYVLSANNELMTCYVGEEKATLAGTYGQTGTNMSLFLADSNNKTRFGSMAFYKSILFDSVPTKETDGFTEQELIDYVIDKYELK